MRIAIIGAGFCGLATAWYLLNTSSVSVDVTLFDSRRIGEGTSGMAAGLLHPFGGAHSKLNRMGREGMECTQELLNVASASLGKTVFIPSGILRPALTTDQQQDFMQCFAKYPHDVQWLSSTDCQTLIPYLKAHGGLLIKHGITVQSALYLQGLWQSCLLKGARFEQRAIDSLQALEDYDHCIVAAGASASFFSEFKSFSLNSVKGQVLELKWPRNLTPLPVPLNSHAYIVMAENQKTCFVGSSFEKDYTHAGPDLKRAQEEIIPKVEELIPELLFASVVGCYAGMRSVTPDHLPLVKQVNRRLWIISGMGSKGLLYHALMAKQLVTQLWN